MNRSTLVLVLCCTTLGMLGCGGYSALPSGSTAPKILAEGWTNGEPPDDLSKQVVVLEMFATW